MEKDELNKFLIGGLFFLVLGLIIAMLLFQLPFSGYEAAIFFILLLVLYRLLIEVENIIFKHRIKFFPTPIRMYGSFKNKDFKIVLTKLLSILIKLDYHDMSIHEALLSKKKWVVLACKPLNSKKIKIFRGEGDTRPKIVLDNEKLYVEYLQKFGKLMKFSKEEAKKLEVEIRRVKEIKLDMVLI